MLPNSPVQRGRRTRRRRIRTYRDRDPEKRFPNSLRLLIVAIQEFWLQELERVPKDTPPLSSKRFFASDDFADCYLRTLDLYKGVARPQRKSVAGVFEDMATGNSDLEYYKIRALAHYTRLRSAALLLLLSQLIGEERRARDEGRSPKQACDMVLKGIQRVIICTRKNLRTKSDGDDLFMRKYDATKDGYLPDMTMLRMWREAFNSGPLPTDPIGVPPEPASLDPFKAPQPS